MAASASLRFPACNFVKKETPANMFFVNFAKFLRTSFDRIPPDDYFLCLPEDFEKFFRTTIFHRAPMGNCLFHVEVAECQPSNTVKNYFTSAF